MALEFFSSDYRVCNGFMKQQKVNVTQAGTSRLLLDRKVNRKMNEDDSKDFASIQQTDSSLTA